MQAGALQTWASRFCNRHSSPPDVDCLQIRTIFILTVVANSDPS